MKNFFATAASVLVLGLAIPAMAETNTSTIQQTGINGSVNVDQLGNSANNSSAVYQGNVWAYSSDNSVDVKQAGTNAIENYSTIYQNGHGNDAKVDQSGDGNGGDYNWSTINQKGAKNKAKVTQGDLVTNNTSLIDQDGFGNEATVKQGGNAGGNLVNYSSIEQDGAKNSANVTQGGVNTVANTSYITQNGFGNSSTVNQH